MPVAIAQRRILRLVVLCALYVAQGIPFGFVAVTLAAYLAGHGASESEIGNLSAFALLPWSFKWAWGPIVDRFARSFMGRRRPWILTAQAMMILTAGALVLVPELRNDLSLLGWIVFLHNVFASLQDVSVDALAVDLLPEGDRGKANGFMYGSKYLGTMLGGAGLSTILGSYGLRAAILVQVVALTGIMLLPLLLRERAGDKLLSFGTHREDPSVGSASIMEVARNLLRAFSRRSPIVGGLLAVTVMIGASALTAVGAVLLIQKLGWTNEEYGQMVGGVPMFFGLGGSILGGYFADRFGHKRVVAASSVLVGLSWIGFALVEPMWTDRNVIVSFVCAEQFLLGTLSASLFALYMDVSWPKVAATQFTAYMALLNLSSVLGAKLSGFVVEAFGTGGSYVAVGVFQVLVVLWLIPIDPHQNRRELGGLADDG